MCYTILYLTYKYVHLFGDLFKFTPANILHTKNKVTKIQKSCGYNIYFKNSLKKNLKKKRVGGLSIHLYLHYFLKILILYLCEENTHVPIDKYLSINTISIRTKLDKFVWFKL